MREDSSELRRNSRLRWRLQRHSIHLGLVTWQEVAFLAVTAAMVVCLLVERDQGGKNRARQLIVGHSSAVKSVTFRPDGMMLSSVGTDGSITLWDLAANQEYPFPREKLGQVRCAAFCPDSKILATANLIGAVTLHNLVTRESHILRDAHNTSAGAASLAFTPDGATLAVGQQDGQITLWDVGTGRNRQALAGHTGFVVSLAFSPDGATLASSSRDHSVRLWDLPAGQGRFVLGGRPNTISILVFSPDGRFLVLGDRVSPVIRFWEVTTGCEHAVSEGLESNLVAVAISPDGATVVAADFHGLVTFWDVSTLRIGPRRLSQAGVHSLAFASDGHTLATGGFDGTIQLWDWPLSVMADAPRPILSLASPVRISRRSTAAGQAGTIPANRPAALVHAAVSRGS